MADVETAVRLATAGLKQQALLQRRAGSRPVREVRRRRREPSGEAGLSLYRRLRDRASALLLQSVHQLPPDRQAPFWRDVVASDPVLRPFIP